MTNKHIDKIISAKQTKDTVKSWLNDNYDEISELINLYPDIQNKELTRLKRMIENDRSLNNMTTMLFIFRSNPPKINSYEYVKVIYGEEYANYKFNLYNEKLVKNSLLCRSLYQEQIEDKLNPFVNVTLNYKVKDITFDIKIGNWLIDVINEKFLDSNQVKDVIDFKQNVCKHNKHPYLQLFDRQWKWNQNEVLKVILENINEKN